MSTKATVTLSVQTFLSWDGAQTAKPEQCCTATAKIHSNDEKKISLDNTDPTNFIINIHKHGDHTSLSFVVVPDEETSACYKGFLPIGIALQESGNETVDPTGTIEFPTVSIADDKSSGDRTLTLDVASNETATWNFFLVIQGIPADNADTGYDIGIIDPRIKGSAN